MIFVSTASLDFNAAAWVRERGRFPEALGIELGARLNREDALELAASAQAHPEARILVHNYFPPPADPFVLNLASPQPQILERSLELCGQALALCARIGCPSYSVHAGLAVDPAPQDLGRPLAHLPHADLEQCRGVFSRSIEILSLKAREHGVRLLIENNILAGFNAPQGMNHLALLCSLEDLTSFDQDFPQDNVGMLLDVGHLKVSAHTLGFDLDQAMRYAVGRVEVLHLHDNDGLSDKHHPFHSGAWFFPYLPALAKQAAMVIETVPSPWSQILSMAEALTGTAWQETPCRESL